MGWKVDRVCTYTACFKFCLVISICCNCMHFLWVWCCCFFLIYCFAEKGLLFIFNYLLCVIFWGLFEPEIAIHLVVSFRVFFLKKCINFITSSDHLKEKLDIYVEEYLPQTKVVHSEERLGLIRARMLGASHASGEVSLLIEINSVCA